MACKPSTNAHQKASTFPLTAKSKRPRFRSVSFPPELCLNDAVRNNDRHEVMSILGEHAPYHGLVTVNLNALNQSGVTALHQCALQGNSAEIARLLLHHGADISARDVDGWQALHAAAAMADVEMVEALLLAGADPLARTPDGEKPEDLIEDYEPCAPKVRVLLQFAARSGRPHVCKGRLHMRWPNSRQDSGVGLEKESESESDAALLLSDSSHEIARSKSEVGFVDITRGWYERDSMSFNGSDDEAFFEEELSRTRSRSLATTTASLLRVAARIVDDRASSVSSGMSAESESLLPSGQTSSCVDDEAIFMAPVALESLPSFTSPKFSNTTRNFDQDIQIADQCTYHVLSLANSRQEIFV